MRSPDITVRSFALRRLLKRARLQRRSYAQGWPQGGYPPPPPPPMPPQFQYPPPPSHHHHAPPGPGEHLAESVVVQVKPSKYDVFREVVWFAFVVGSFGLILYQVQQAPSGGGLGKLGGGKLGLGGNDVKPQDLTNFNTTFTDVRGCDEAKAELEEIVEFLKDPSKFTRLGGKLPKGALLVGPPGTGKTMLAKAIAKEADVPFFYMSGAEFDEMFVGVGSRRVRDLFDAAKKVSPALIFIDELDAIGAKRSAKDQSYHRMTLNQMLSEMDGFMSDDKVIVLGATNTPGSLDKALTRPGRFDRIISVDAPDVHGRKQILDLYLGKIKGKTEGEESIDSQTLARGLPGFCGADLKNIVNIAAIKAAMLGKKLVDNADLEYARDRVSMGSENRSKFIPLKERTITAWHEGGHALVALLCDEADPVHKATIVPRGSGILGLVLQHPEDDRYSMSRQQMKDRLKVALGGRAGEEVYFGGPDDVTSGAASDFENATMMARNMVRKYGMAETEVGAKFQEGGQVGVVDWGEAEENDGAYLSDETKEHIEHATKMLLDSAFQEAKKLLLDNKDKLKQIAEGLLVHETLTGDQMRALVREGKALPPAPDNSKGTESKPESDGAATGGGGADPAPPAPSPAPA